MSTEMLQEIRKMSIRERLCLVEEIWNTIADDQDEGELPEWQKKELDRRLAEHEKNPHDTVTWESVKAQLGRTKIR